MTKTEATVVGEQKKLMMLMMLMMTMKKESIKSVQKKLK
jgi:hypothetical protein